MQREESFMKIDENTADKIAIELDRMLYDYNKRKRKNKKLGEPIIVCVGSDLAIFDAVGPLCGTLLREKLPDVCLFGEFKALQTAKNIQQTAKYIKKEYSNRPVIAIDAALHEERVGDIKIINQPLKPGTGAKKDLGEVGEITIMGITGRKTDGIRNGILGNTTRLGMVYEMADAISDGFVLFLKKWRKNNQTT